MAKVRVYELAKELGVESKVLLEHLKSSGEFVRSASSTIEPPVVRKLRESFSTEVAAGKVKGAKPATGRAPAPTKSAPPAASPGAPAATPGPRPSAPPRPGPARPTAAPPEAPQPHARRPAPPTTAAEPAAPDQAAAQPATTEIAASAAAESTPAASKPAAAPRPPRPMSISVRALSPFLARWISKEAMISNER